MRLHDIGRNPARASISSLAVVGLAAGLANAADTRGLRRTHRGGGGAVSSVLEIGEGEKRSVGAAG